MTPEMRAAIPPALREDDAMAALSSATTRTQLIRDARILFNTPSRVVSTRAVDAGVPSPDRLRAARRIGTYPTAPNRISMHPHDLAGQRIMLPMESGLELAAARELDFTPTTRWMFTQPFVIMWPVGDHCIYRIPDFLVSTVDGFRVVDVKPDGAFFRTPYVVAMFELTRLTLAACDWRHVVYGDVTPMKRANLRDIAQQRWRNPHLEPLLAEIRASRPVSLGGIIDVAPRWQLGVACALHLLAHELDVDLDKPLTMGSRTSWSDSSGRDVGWPATDGPHPRVQPIRGRRRRDLMGATRVHANRLLASLARVA